MLHSFFSQPLLVILLQVLLIFCAWGGIAILVGYAAQALLQGVAHLQRLHSIPCNRCVYRTGHYQLPCTVRPIEAFTEQAINCPDCLLASRPMPRNRTATSSWIKAGAIPVVNLLFVTLERFLLAGLEN